MTGFTATFTNPKFNITGGGSGVSESVPLTSWAIDLSFDVASSMFVTIQSSVNSKYSQETSDSNPVQLNATQILKRGSGFWFRGFVKDDPVFIIGRDGLRYMNVEIGGPDFALTQAFCKDSTGSDIWTLETSSFQLTDLPLQPTSAYGNYQGDTLWPDPDDATGIKCYISDALSNTDTLTVAFNISDTTIILSTTDPGFNVRGWVQIDSEWVYYDGKDNADGDGKWRLRNCVRGQLDTTEANHAISTTVTERIAKIIAPAPIQLENDESADSPDEGFIKRRRRKEFTIQQSIGCFVLPAPSDGLYRATYKVYDEDSSLDAGSTTVSVNDVVETMLTGAANDDGPGLETFPIIDVNQGTKTFTLDGDHRASFTVGDFAAVYGSTGNDLEYTIVSLALNAGDTEVEVTEAIADVTVDGKISPDLFLHSSTAALRITRYDYDPETKPKFVFTAVQDFLNSIGLQDEIKLWYKHNTGKFRLRIIKNDSKFFSVPWVTTNEKERSLEDIPSGVRISYTDEQELNRTSLDHSWHQEATGSGTSPDFYRACPDSPSWDEGPGCADFTAAGNGGMSFVADGKPKTKLIGQFNHDPGGTFEFGHWWFGTGTTPPTIKLNEIRLKVANYRVLGPAQAAHQNADKTWVVRTQGCDDYNSSTNTGTWVDLGFEMEGFPEGTAKWAEGAATAFIKNDVNAARVLFDYMPGPKKANQFYGIIHDLEIFGNSVQYTTVNLTADVGDIGDPQFLYAPDTYSKLRGGLKARNLVGGMPRMYHHRIGASSDGAAISLGRVLLLTKLRLHSMRRIEYTGVLPAKPELGLTLGIDEDNDGVDDYIGVLRQLTIVHTSKDGSTIAQGTILDSTEDAIT